MSIQTVEYLSDGQASDILGSYREPDISHTCGKNTTVFRVIDDIISFGQRDASFGGKIDIHIAPKNGRGYSLLAFGVDEDNKVEVPITHENITLGSHTIDIRVAQEVFRLCEHILGVLEGLNVYGAKIMVNCHNGGISWPIEEGGSQEYAQKILDNSHEAPEIPQEYFTVQEPVKITFSNTRQSSIILLPRDSSNKTIYDVNMNYPQKSIGGARRIVYQKGDIETFVSKVALARTNVSGIKHALLYIPPIIRPVLKFLMKGDLMTGVKGDGDIMKIYSDYIGDPNDTFFRQGDVPAGFWSELGYHSILDKMGADGVGFSGELEGKQFAGYKIYDQSSHRDDIAVNRLLQNGSIPTEIL